MNRTNWLWGVAAGIVMALFALYPQINLQQQRGAEFQGAFATCDLDEMAYASYLQALIDGRPRRNDPYTGRDHAPPDAPQPESLFSIQFIPGYLAAIPARIFGLSAVQMMPVISAFSAFFTVLALFWLIVSMTGDVRLAAVGALAVAVGGALISGIGAIGGFSPGGIAYPFFPFMRRHIPSLAFPFLFLFLACLWNGLHAERNKTRAIYSFLAGGSFAVLVFSYFYLWTSAAAALACLIGLILIFRRENWRRDVHFLFLTGGICVLCLVPYTLLLSNRAATMDKAQLLVLTHQPDLLRRLAVTSYFVLLLLALVGWRKFVGDKTVLFAGACALSPLVVFNQQILSGRSLQPFHYEYYSMNYVVALAVVLLILMIWQGMAAKLPKISAVLLVVFAVATVYWGFYEAKETTKFWDEINAVRDDAMPVNRRLRQLAEDAKRNGENPLAQMTVNFDSLQADSQPTVAPQPVLWARHQHVFAGVKSQEENKERYFQMLYYAGFDENWLRTALYGCSDIEACMVLFGWDRFNATLSVNARPLTQGEVEAELRNFAAFRANFNRQNAAAFPLSYLVVHRESERSLSNLDRWYERDEGETVGKYKLYRLKLR